MSHCIFHVVDCLRLQHLFICRTLGGMVSTRFCPVSPFEECAHGVRVPGLFLANRSSMLLSRWLPDRRAKLLRITWTSSKISGRSRSACWRRPWMTSPQWTTSSLSQVSTPTVPDQAQKEEIRNVAQMSQVCDSVLSLALGALSHCCTCDYSTLLKILISRHWVKAWEGKK